jgi:hypothetical protein
MAPGRETSPCARLAPFSEGNKSPSLSCGIVLLYDLRMKIDGPPDFEENRVEIFRVEEARIFAASFM